jgi:phytol kinase
MDRQQLISFAWATCAFLGVSYGVYYLCGLLVDWYRVPIAYTRKLMHFVTYALPWTLQHLFGFENSLIAAVAAACLVPLHMLVFVAPLRRRSAVLSRMFRGIERPEDRPYTLFWLMTQFGAAYSAYAVVYAGLIARDATEWMIIPLLVLTVGDGLAEPVGVAFGRHSYTTRALNGARLYHRTLEGSACVLISGCLAVAACSFALTTPQLIAVMLIVPMSGTIAEAFAPHTWDQPIMLAVMGGELLAISYL